MTNYNIFLSHVFHMYLVVVPRPLERDHVLFGGAREERPLVAGPRVGRATALVRLGRSQLPLQSGWVEIQ